MTQNKSKTNSNPKQANSLSKNEPETKLEKKSETKFTVFNFGQKKIFGFSPSIISKVALIITLFVLCGFLINHFGFEKVPAIAQNSSQNSTQNSSSQSTANSSNRTSKTKEEYIKEFQEELNLKNPPEAQPDLAQSENKSQPSTSLSTGNLGSTNPNLSPEELEKFNNLNINGGGASASNGSNPSQSPAEDQSKPAKNKYIRVKVEKIVKEGYGVLFSGGQSFRQELEVMAMDTDLKGKTLNVVYEIIRSQERNKIKLKDELIVVENLPGQYSIQSIYRLPNVIMIVVGFLVITVLVIGMKGIWAVLSLVISVFTIGGVVIPQILAGQDAFLVCFLAAIFLTFINIYMAHGLRRRSTIALISVLVSLVFSAIISILLSNYSMVYGVGSEEALYLQPWEGAKLDLRELFWGGMILSTLGVLDDVATAQAAVIEELHLTDPSMPFWQLLKKGMSVGKEHITSMINTLAFAYVGVALPSILSFAIIDQPVWFILSSDGITEEIVRTVGSSLALVLCVPLCNFVGAFYLTRKHRIKS